MKIEKTVVFGFEPALRGMRNPLESWGKSDSVFYGAPLDRPYLVPEHPLLGPKDLELACKLIRSGGDHRKFMRQIQIWADITIPRDVWQELDTYKIATVRNSCSTMYKLGSRDLTFDDFEKHDVSLHALRAVNAMGEHYRNGATYYEEDAEVPRNYGGVELLEHMKHRLPEGFLQKATYSFNYETALKLYGSRHNHRMPQWSGPGGICEWIRSLPYMAEFLAEGAP